MSESAPLAEDVELVRRCLQRDEAAVRKFVERFEGPIFGLCCRMLRHRQDAEDVTQLVLVRALQHLAKWDSSRLLTPWVYTIAVNRCRTALGSRGKLPVFNSDTVRLAGGMSAPVMEVDMADELELGLSHLREEYRLCFVMFHQQELSCAEIGQALGCPEGTVKTWLHRARKELATWLSRHDVETEAES